MDPHLGIVTVTVDRDRAEPCLASWRLHATVAPPPVVVVEHGTEATGWLDTVTAFSQGVDRMMREPDVEVIACLHDDLVIFDEGWDRAVLDCFADHPDCGLAGFVGVDALDADGRRRGLRSRFVSLDDPEVLHSGEPTRVASVDGCALVGRRAFWSGFLCEEWRTKTSRRKRFVRPWAQLAAAGFVHYWTDDALACVARRGRWDAWYVPVRGRHLGGLTVRDPRYQAWAAAEAEGGDRGFYEAAHRLGQDTFRDVLPLDRPGTPADGTGARPAPSRGPD